MWSTYLDEVSQQFVGLSIGFLHLLELVAEAHAVSLKVQIGVLASWDLVLIDICVPGFHSGCAVKWSIETTGHFPVLTVVKDLIQRDAWRREQMGKTYAFRSLSHLFFFFPLRTAKWKILDVPLRYTAVISKGYNSIPLFCTWSSALLQSLKTAVTLHQMYRKMFQNLEMISAPFETGGLRITSTKPSCGPHHVYKVF